MTLDKLLIALCYANKELRHRQINKNYNLKSDNIKYKYICYDSRNCVYKKSKDEIKYCLFDYIYNKEK